MANIQRGDTKQYLTKGIAEQDFTGNAANIFESGVQSAYTITQKANESTLANNQIDLSANFLLKNNEINTKYQNDPTNPQREIELKDAFESIANQYKINPVCQKQWSEIKNSVYGRYKMYNAQWQEKQLQTNAQINLKDGRDKLLQQAYQLGFDDTGIEDAKLIFANGYDAIKNGAEPQLGTVLVGEALKTTTHDFMAMYLTGMMQNNPAGALQLLNDENSGIMTDLNNAETYEKLKKTAQAKLLKKAEVDAVDRIAGYVTNNNEMFNKLFDGTISTAEVEELLQNENVDRRMREIISDMAGYKMSNDISVDAETGKVTQKESASAGQGEDADNVYSELVIGNKKWTFIGKKGQIRKPTEQEKDEITSELYLKGSQILNGIDNKTPQDAMRQVAEFQSQIAQARYFGIDKGDYNKLMNDFVLPATQNIQEEAKDYSDRAHWYGHHKYGYNQIQEYFDKNFSDAKTKEEKKERNKEQALASVYYWAGLQNECSKRGIKMSDLKSLSGTEKASIYSKSAKQAIDMARANSANPQVWFRSANPQYVSMIRSMLPNSQANNVITNIAVSAMSNPSMSEKDFNNLIQKEVQKEYAKMRTSNKSVVFGGNTKYDEIINQYSMMHGVDPLLIKAIIKQESGFNAKARSKAGAGGLMQLMPKTASGLGVKDIYDPKQNIAGGTKYFAGLLNKYNGNIPLALAAYNAGSGNVAKYGNKIPPFKETQNYVKNIMATYNSIKG